MNAIKLKVYQFQHPFVCSTYINTFDRQDMVDEGNQTIRQHRFANFTISPSKMSTLFFHQQDLSIFFISSQHLFHHSYLIISIVLHTLLEEGIPFAM
jgi:hypothetical protein